MYSREEALTPEGEIEQDAVHKKRATPGSVAFVPAVAGLILAGEVVKDIVNNPKK